MFEVFKNTSGIGYKYIGAHKTKKGALEIMAKNARYSEIIYLGKNIFSDTINEILYRVK